ncbi:MAG: helix-turn-helix transcriptional regulator [Lachnospiraceae bacterium]|nr:helix-turn-helix transcriptional regulator [Lachnospiraceae bacterium]
MDYKLLGKRICEERHKLGLTQEVLAEDTSISTAYLGMIERGQRKIVLDKLVQIANRLGVSIDYLLSDALTNDEDTTIDQIRQLLQSKSYQEKKMAIDVLKIMLSYTDHKI